MPSSLSSLLPFSPVPAQAKGRMTAGICDQPSHLQWGEFDIDPLKVTSISDARCRVAIFESQLLRDTYSDDVDTTTPEYVLSTEMRWMPLLKQVQSEHSQESPRVLMLWAAVRLNWCVSLPCLRTASAYTQVIHPPPCTLYSPPSPLPFFPRRSGSCGPTNPKHILSPPIGRKTQSSLVSDPPYRNRRTRHDSMSRRRSTPSWGGRTNVWYFDSNARCSSGVVARGGTFTNGLLASCGRVRYVYALFNSHTPLSCKIGAGKTPLTYRNQSGAKDRYTPRSDRFATWSIPLRPHSPILGLGHYNPGHASERGQCSSVSQWFCCRRSRGGGEWYKKGGRGRRIHKGVWGGKV